ncbi:MAG: glycohydrolase toxin TNT-related protein [Luteolibacter sp.]
MNSFRDGSIVARQATGNENLLRFFGGDAQELGRFLTPNFPQGSARSLLALPPNNTATGLGQFNLRQGATFFEGTVAPNFGKSGGGAQIFVPNLNDLVKP